MSLSLFFVDNTPWPFLQHCVWLSFFPPYCSALPIPILQPLKLDYFISSYPFRTAVSIHRRLPGAGVAFSGAFLVVLVGLGAASFRPSSSSPLSTLLSSAVLLVCVLLSAWAHILQRLCPLHSQRQAKLHFLPSRIQLTLTLFSIYLSPNPKGLYLKSLGAENIFF